MPRAVPGDFTVVAVIAAYNEADIIGPVVHDLVAQGILVYLIDDGSTDATVDEVARFRDKGLIGIERLGDAGRTEANAAGSFSLRRIIERKQELTRKLDATWLINHDADEFRESPWPGVGLLEGIRMVDGLGYNAIDFEVLNFWPSPGERLQPGQDPRQVFRYFERGGSFDRLQIRCWKNLGGPLDLVSNAGHEAVFPGRKVFPIRFLLRHYPFRSQAHGERKLFEERCPRYARDEVEHGWHRQYSGVERGTSFVRDPEQLQRYDPDRIRFELLLRHRYVEQLEGSPEAIQRVREAANKELELAIQELDRLRPEAEHQRRQAEALERLQTDIETIHGSLSWRLTAPLRAVGRMLRGY
jgi:hypothetical protein